MIQRYEKYKDSGVLWLGEIPGHWKCIFIGRLFNIKAGGDAKPEFYSPFKDLLHPYPVYTNTKSDNDVYAYTSFPTCETNTITVTGRGEVGHAIFRTTPYDAIIRLLSLSPKSAQNCKYFSYFIDTVIPFTSDSAAIGQLSAVQIRSKSVLLPPLSEQHSIVTYLDSKCSKIDEWINKKQKEVELLGEAKQRIIADAVTRGLNPNVKMKKTGIAWLEEVPEHWRIERAKNLFNKEQRPIQPNDEIVTCFRDGEVTLRKNRRTTGFTEATDYSHYQHICIGDLVIHQMDAFAGSSGVSDSEGMGTPVLSVCTPKTNDVDNYYYAHIVRLMGHNGFILSLYRGIRERSSDFRFDTFAKQYLPVPPLSEQQAIVSYITSKTTKIDSLMSAMNKEIEHLKEYKQRLISDVVTGQIKVC